MSFQGTESYICGLPQIQNSGSIKRNKQAINYKESHPEDLTFRPIIVEQTHM